MIPFVAKIEELSFVKVNYTRGEKPESNRKAKKGGGLIAAVVPATVGSAGFIDQPHLEVLDTLEWGFNLKIVNPSTNNAVVITGIDCRFAGKSGYGCNI